MKKKTKPIEMNDIFKDVDKIIAKYTKSGERTGDEIINAIEAFCKARRRSDADVSVMANYIKDDIDYTQKLLTQLAEVRSKDAFSVGDRVIIKENNAVGVITKINDRKSYRYWVDASDKKLSRWYCSNEIKRKRIEE